MTKDKKNNNIPEEELTGELGQQQDVAEDSSDKLADELSDDKEFIEEDPAEESIESVEKLQADLQKANDKYLRLHAEFDNYRRRTAKESLNLVVTANAQLISKQCEILDNFDRAFVEENKAPDLETLEKGMQMIHGQFVKVLEDAGLTTIDPIGKEFNPEEHEALMKQPSNEIEEGFVVTVFQKGYKLGEKVLRHAKVIVSSGPAEVAEGEE